jgi:hypothetical protein
LAAVKTAANTFTIANFVETVKKKCLSEKNICSLYKDSHKIMGNITH